MSPDASTLASRGAELAASGGLRPVLGRMLANMYHPDTNPSGIVNIGTSENYIMLDEVTEFANKHFSFSAKDLSYGEGPWGAARLRRAMARHMNRYFHPHVPVDPDEILFSSGITSMCEMLGFTIADPGDGVLFSRPIYQAFPADFGTKAKVKCVFVSFEGVDQFSTAAVEKYEAALLQAETEGTKIRALMLCHPHNPLGQCYPKDTIVGLMRLCQKYRIHLLSDEIYALSVYDVPSSTTSTAAVPFTSVLSFDSSPYIDASLLHVLYGMSKDFAGGGLRLGCIYTRNAEFLRALGVMSQFHWPSTLPEKLATLMLEDDEWLEVFLATSRKRLAERNALTRGLLEKHGINYSKWSNAGFFIWVDLRPWLPKGIKGWEAERKLAEKMKEKAVYATPGEAMSAEEPGFFRIIFSQDERIIREGLERLVEALDS